MILAFELTWTGTHHAPVNSAALQTVAQALPGHEVQVFADESHLLELRRDPSLTRLERLTFHPIVLAPQYRHRPGVVSFRRMIREFAILHAALRNAPRSSPCFVLLLSATSTSIFAISVIQRTTRRSPAVHVGLHGNLNDMRGWRSRNPIVRTFDMHSALFAHHSPKFRFLVLEPAIRRQLAELAPRAASVTDVLPHPVNIAEISLVRLQPLCYPLRIGFAGQATEAKGITFYLQIVEEFTARYASCIEFHVIGRAYPGDDLQRFSGLASKVTHEHLTRQKFVDRLAHMHYVFLPFGSTYYDLSASGALLDAITWLKPIIANRTPVVADMFEQFGDIGYLCNGVDAMRHVLHEIANDMDGTRYAVQVEALRRLRDSRLPDALARNYRTIVSQNFPELAQAAGPGGSPANPFRENDCPTDSLPMIYKPKSGSWRSL
jgi:hypothetical protein